MCGLQQFYVQTVAVLSADCCGIVCGLLWFCVRTVAVLCADRCGIVCGLLQYCVPTVAVLCADCCGIVCGLLRYCVWTVVVLCGDCCGIVSRPLWYCVRTVFKRLTPFLRSKFSSLTFHSMICFTKKSVSSNLLKRNPNPFRLVYQHVSLPLFTKEIFEL